MPTYDIIDKNEAKRLLNARLNNQVTIYGLGGSTVIFRHVETFDDYKYEYLIENAKSILHYYYNDHPECGRQVDFKFGEYGMATYFSVEVQKLLPVCNLDNKDLCD